MDQRPSRSFLISALALLALVIGACTPGATPGTGTAPPGGGATGEPTGEPRRGGELRFQLIRDSSTGYDPGLATESTVFTIDQAIFDTLMEIQPNGDLAPSLATDWEISDDELTYTFTIRSGVLFHNGREMTSEDVKYTIERMQDPETASPRRNIYAIVESIETPDATTLIIRIREPFAPLIYALADITAGIVPREVVEAEGDLHENPVGTGPFRFVEHVRDQHVKVERNPDYWRDGLPYLDGITYSFNSDPNARAAAIRSANIDFLWNSPPELFEVLSSDPELEIYGGEGTLTWQYLLLNVQQEPFDDVRVRQAIFWALDREEIRQISRPNTTTPLNSGFLPPEHWAGVPQSEWIYTQDLERSRELLAEAGLAEGFDMTIMTLVGSNFHIRSAQAIQQQLQEIGVTVEINIVDTAELLSARNDALFHSMVLGFSGTIDPDERFQQTFMTGGGTNYVEFSDPVIDDLATQARMTSDRDERARLYREAQLRLAEVGPFAFIYNYHFFDTLQSYVKGYTFNPQLIDYRSVREIWLDK